MKIYYEKYIEQEKQLPDLGKNIIGQSDNESIIVYQAFNNNVADFAIKNQALGGDSFSFNRMTWIKPNFLWMMYRAGWATKVNQERILAIRLTNQDFVDILKQAVHSTFKPDIYESYELWKQKLDNSEVRLQWDPDHDPFGVKKERKAIQLGLKGTILKKYCSEWIIEIIDLTDFVKSEKSKLDSLAIDDLIVPIERIIEGLDDELKKTLEITGYTRNKKPN